MFASAQRFRDAVSQWFLPGAVYTFVGAGGKTTAMKRVAALVAEAGVKARLTTTTKVGIEELVGIPVSLVSGPEDLPRAMADDSPCRLLVGGVLRNQGKYSGLDPRLIQSASLSVDTVLLVEGDGSRRHPMKTPKSNEPVIPASTSIVFALMGASALDQPIDEAHCYNHEKALELLGRTSGLFEAPIIASLSADPDGSRKGVLPGMAYRLLINQGDLEQRRASAMEALRIAGKLYGVEGALVSFQKEELYGSTDD
jgi:probable selenium-dependent hydroxylase accessory protein YqeC